MTTSHAPESPNAELVSVDARDGGLKLTVRINGVLAPPVSPASLFDVNDRSAFVELHRLVALDHGLATFESDKVVVATLDVGNRYLVRSWWTSDQLELARDLNRVWTEIQFRSAPALAYVRDRQTILGRATEGAPPGAVLVPQGWEHEHCALCWATISETLGNELAYVSGNNWLCSECHHRYLISGFGQRLGDTIP
jgi:hypothetical protein